ncbi:MAG TPA: glycosyltransferase [Acidobacteriota bacterium]|nr:glycosyltransferase [Acidobacteriota bacterium]
MPRPIKIAYVIDTIVTPSAGTEKQLLMLLHGLDKTRFKPFLICLRDSDWLGRQSLPFDVTTLDVASLLSVQCLRGLRRFRQLHGREQFDIVQTFFDDGNIFGTLAARLAGCRTVISSRRNIGYRHGRMHRFILRRLRRWTNHYLANSTAVAQWTTATEGVVAAKLKVIHNGLDLQAFESVPEGARQRQRAEWGIGDDETLIGALANLRPVKNVESLIEAAAALCPEFSNIKFVVVGEGPERNQYQRFIDNRGLTDRFALVGRYSNVIPCLAAFDIAVMCSKSESFSNSLIEYMAMGLPVAASDVGGNPEAVTHRETGLLYSVEDGASLAGALRELLTDKAMASRLGEKARRDALLKYNTADTLAHHQTYYEQITHRN